MDRTRVMDLADKVGGLFRLTVLLQKRVRELVGGSPPLIDTELTNPIDIAMAEVEVDAIELVDLSDEEIKALEAETKMASEEAEILEALRSRVTSGAEVKAATTKTPAPKPAAAPAAKEEAAAKDEAPAKEEAAAKDEAAAKEEAPAEEEAPATEAAVAPAADEAAAEPDSDKAADDTVKAE